MTRVAVITSGFPRRSETFAVTELLALEQAGMLAAVFATKPGDGLPPHRDVTRLRTAVHVLPSGAGAIQGAAVAAELRGLRVDALHGYFAHKPASVAAFAARTLGVPYGFSVHARDARKVPRAAFASRAEAAACVIACNRDVAREVASANGNLHIVPHGVDLERFAASGPRRSHVARLVAVGRLVEKKGFAVLLEAAALASSELEIRVVGDGPERERLEAQIAHARLEGRVTLVGSRTHDELPQEFARADLVVMPSIADRTGDRDGLPNVILEAMASARPLVATRVGAIASAVKHGATGFLVAPNDAAALAEAIDALLADRDALARMGRAARREVERHFALPDCTRRFRRVLDEAYG